MTDRRYPLLERPVMRKQFRMELRGRLMSEASVVLAPRARRFSFSAMLRPALAAAAIVVLVFAGATSAAASSLPGDALYAVKRATEDARVALTFDGSARLALLSELADRRLEELAAVALERPSEAPAATQRYAEAAERVAAAFDRVAGSDANTLGGPSGNNEGGRNVEAAQAKRLAILDALIAKIPDNARVGIERLIQRERDRHATTPTAPATDGGQEIDNKNDTGDAKKATPRPATPSPQRATPRPTGRGGPGDQNGDRQERD